MSPTMRHYQIHDFLHISVSTALPGPLLDQFDFQFDYFEVERGAETPSIEVYPFDTFETRPGETVHYDTSGRYGTYWYDTDRKLAVVRTDDGFTVYTASGVNLYPLLQSQLLHQECVFVHAAGYVDSDGGATLLPGAGGVGKTALLGQLVTSHDVQVLGDDIVCLDVAGDCFSFPRSFVFKAYHRDVYPAVFEKYDMDTKRVRERIATVVLRSLIDNAPFVGLTKSLLHRFGYYEQTSFALSKIRGGDYLATVPADEIYGPESIATSGTLDRVVFLRRVDDTEFKLAPLSHDELRNRLFSIILREWQSELPILCELGSLGMLELSAYFDELATVMARGIADTPCHEFLVPEDASPDTLHEQFVAAVNVR
ncbi:hypothetical protein [Haloarcula halophila]|uniref:hypothetical protein n=1 Tax=Haloarcula TaxID=2237 RepID=UPI0023E46537|nr:hypothetical protein [Halomicroarcula sp. DFY41]